MEKEARLLRRPFKKAEGKERGGEGTGCRIRQ
jgi:hypothetical protein